MKLILILLTFTFSLQCMAKLTDVKDIIKDPIISRRCKTLLKERAEKIQIKERLNSLILRNQKLQNRAKSNQKTIINRLGLAQTQLSNTMRLTQIRIQSMEEDIVRKGCPGITL